MQASIRLYILQMCRVNIKDVIRGSDPGSASPLTRSFKSLMIHMYVCLDSDIQVLKQL